MGIFSGLKNFFKKTPPAARPAIDSAMEHMRGLHSAIEAGEDVSSKLFSNETIEAERAFSRHFGEVSFSSPIEQLSDGSPARASVSLPAFLGSREGMYANTPGLQTNLRTHGLKDALDLDTARTTVRETIDQVDRNLGGGLGGQGYNAEYSGPRRNFRGNDSNDSIMQRISRRGPKRSHLSPGQRGHYDSSVSARRNGGSPLSNLARPQLSRLTEASNYSISLQRARLQATGMDLPDHPNPGVGDIGNDVRNRFSSTEAGPGRHSVLDLGAGLHMSSDASDLQRAYGKKGPGRPRRGSTGGGGGGAPPGGGGGTPGTPSFDYRSRGRSSGSGRSHLKNIGVALADTFGTTAIGGILGGAGGAIGYDEDSEQDPLYQNSPFLGRVRAAAVGAVGGAAFGMKAGIAAGTFKGAGRLIGGQAVDAAGANSSLFSSFGRGFKRGFKGSDGASWQDRVFEGVSQESEYGAGMMSDLTAGQRYGHDRRYMELGQAKNQTPETVAAAQKQYEQYEAAGERYNQMSRGPERAGIRDSTGADPSVINNMGGIDPGKWNSSASEQWGMALHALPNTVAHIGGMVAGTVPLAIKGAYDYYKKSVNPGYTPFGVGKIKDSVKQNGFRGAIGDYFNKVDPITEQKSVAYGIESAANSTLPVAIGGAGLLGSALFAGAEASSYGAPQGHPYNAVFGNPAAGTTAQAQSQADYSNKIRMQKPNMIGLNDIDENYFANPSLRGQRGHQPGMYNDDGGLVFALSALRRGN
jgi:hypothetical protein